MSPMNLRSGKGQFSYERRRGDDLFALGKDRLLVDVYHFELVAALEVLLADLLDVRDRPCARPG